MKQADIGWGSRRPPLGYPKWPTVVLEVGVSDTQSKLRHDMDLWLDPSRGNVKVAISNKVNHQRPMISIETWRSPHYSLASIFLTNSLNTKGNRRDHRRGMVAQDYRVGIGYAIWGKDLRTGSLRLLALGIWHSRALCE